MKKLLSLNLILIFSFSFFSGCKKDKGDSPVLPPQESMIIDFSNFNLKKKSDNVNSVQKGTENSNWEFVAEIAFAWNSFIISDLAVPVTSYKLAFNQSPVYQSEKNWQWSYPVTVAGVSYKARLTGLIGVTDVTWKMYITKEGTGGFTDFLWLEGTSKLDGTGGHWIFNQSPQSPTAFLQIDWTQSGASIVTITYTFQKNGDPFKTSTIQYGLMTGTLNAYYTIRYYNASILRFSNVNAEWNTTTRNGRMKCLDYLGDTDWHCWDANKINITCL